MAKVVKEETEKKLTDFAWDDDLKFFDQEVDAEEVAKENFLEPPPKKKEEKEETKKEETEEEETIEKEEVEEEKKEEDSVEFFKGETKEEVEDDENNPEFFKKLATNLKEKGIFEHVEVEKDEQISEERFVELQDEEINARVDETFESFFEELDDDGKAFLKFKKDGGDTSDFFRVKRNVTGIPEGDISDEKYQKRLIAYYSKNVEGLDDEEIEDRLEWLTEGGKLETYATRYETKLEKKKDETEKKLLDDQKQRQKDEEKTKTAFITTLKETVTKADKIKGITITKKDKNELVNYISKPSVKVGKNKFVTPFQADMQKTTQNYDTLVLLAKMLKGDFDFSGIEREIDTKKSKKLNKEIQRQKVDLKPKSSGSSGKKQLSDFFN